MKFSCEKNKLLNIINIVQKAVPSKSTVKVMECIKIDASAGGRISFTGSNLELYIEYTSECEVSEGGSAAVESKVFGEIVRRMPEGTVNIRINDENNVVKISGGRSELSISSSDTREYPEKPQVNGNISFSVKQRALRDMIRQVIFAAGVNNARPVLNGVLFEVKDGRIRTVALDNARLALRETETDDDIECKFIVPQVTLKEIQKLFKDDDSIVNISVSDKHAIFDFGDFTVIARLIDGEFINYSAIVSKARNTIFAELETDVLCDSLERASLLINDDSANKQNLPVKLLFSNGILEVNCMTSKGMIHDTVPIKLEGDDIEIGFNYKFLLESLRATEEERVRFEISGPLSSCFLVSAEEENNYLYIVQPVRL
ncbi:MAG: DNA polymerase III subunit beta [Oscillospiraceae bacterium]|nr:DNA polymerase III subunit beta [Oscillospiraceae bacterium]